MSLNILFNFIRKRLVFTGTFALIILLAISFAIREKDFNKVTGIGNLEATYHAMLTIKALKASPIENHWLLPTVTLGGKLDKDIRWGATVRNRTGDYVYTSFAPPGFLAPYIAFAALESEASEKNIARFNFILGSLVSLVLYALLVKLLEKSGYTRQIAVGGAVLGTTISIFSKEVLQSHGLVYWSHSLYQLILVACLYLLFAHLNYEDNNINKKNKYTAYLVGAVFLGAWTEWTGYVFGVGLAILFWFGISRERPQRALSIKLILAVTAAGFLTLIHYGVAAGFEPTIKAFIDRFLARNTASGNLIGLLNGYALSFGLFVIITFAAVTATFFFESKDKIECPAALKNTCFLFLAATIPLLENIIMLQHAIQFSFDRLKWLFPAAIIISVAFARQSSMCRIMLAISLVFASIQGYNSYRSDLSQYSSWTAIDANNKYLVNSILKSTDIEHSVLLSNGAVRGYANLLLNRGIHEKKSKDDSKKLIIETQASSAIYIEGTSNADLPFYIGAMVTKSDGSIVSLAPLEIETICTDFFLADSNFRIGVDRNWSGYILPNTHRLSSQLIAGPDLIFQKPNIRKIVNAKDASNFRIGVARNWSGFIVPNTHRLKAQLVAGSDLIFQNGDIREIVNVEDCREYLKIYIAGMPLNTMDTGYPNSYIVRTKL